MVVIDGKKIAENIRNNLKKEVLKLKDRGITPKLCVILVGDNPASKIYVGVKEKYCKEVGINFTLEILPTTITENNLIKKVVKLNKDKNTNGIIVQLPLPNHINKYNILKILDPEKDVDGLTPSNLGGLVLGYENLSPATPKGIIKLLDCVGINLSGKSVTVINRSLNVGKPLTHLLINRDATVIVCHSKTKNLENYTKNSDIVVCAVGKPGFLTKDMVKEGSVVIDVGLTYVDGKGVGDVDFENLKNKTSYITPVPSGVGPMTVAMILENTILATKKQHKL